MAGLLSGLLKDKQAASIEVIIQPDNQRLYNFILVKEEKGSIYIDKSKIGITDPEELKKLLPSNVPVSLILNGKGIMHRIIPVTDKDTDTLLLQKILPNAQIQDFYIQQFPATENKVAVSVIRKDQFQLTIDEFSSFSQQIISVFSGPFIAANLLPLINANSDENETLHFSTYKLQFENRVLYSFDILHEKTEKEYDFSGNKVPSPLMLVFAGALSFFISDTTGIKNNIEYINFNRDEFRQKKLFRLQLGGILSFLFLAMLINFLVFSSFFSKKNKLSAQVSLVQNQLQMHDTLLKEIKQKKTFLEEAGLLEDSKLSFYADQLAADLPSYITLTELNVNPLVKNATPEGEVLNITNKFIKLSGHCSLTTILNEWINTLEKKKWIKNVRMINYSQLKSSEPGEFTLEIYLQ
jgi:Tfp pilus assembly protein PilN